MKMQDTHRAQLFSLLDERVVAAVSVAALQDHFHVLEQIAIDCKGDVKKQFRWNMLYRMPSAVRQPLFDELYLYLNDDHIDTALRTYIKERPVLNAFVKIDEPAIQTAQCA